tara:strand:- start:335 stop:559 length:225 start_codon:yes stop_codon:yes gene_type:complete
MVKGLSPKPAYSTPWPCHFSIVTMGKREIVSSAADVKPPPGPAVSDEWKKTGTVSQLQTGPLQVRHVESMESNA